MCQSELCPGFNYIYYWCDGFRDASVEQTEVPVRYDPFNIGRAYAYVRGQWRNCVSEHYIAFCDRTERELMIASAELRRCNQQHGQRFNVTARKIADFLTAVGTEEQALLRQQRRRDAEARQIKSTIAYVPMSKAVSATTLSSATPDTSRQSELDEGEPYALGAMSLSIFDGFRVEVLPQHLAGDL